MDDNRDEIGHLLYKFRHEQISSLPKVVGNWVMDRMLCMLAVRNTRTFSTLRYFCRFLCYAHKDRIKEELYNTYFYSLKRGELKPNADREYDLCESDVVRLMHLVTYDGLARVALKEVALGLTAMDLPVLLVIEIGGWLAAAHHNYADELNFGSAWEIAKKVKHWSEE